MKLFRYFLLGIAFSSPAWADHADVRDDPNGKIESLRVEGCGDLDAFLEYFGPQRGEVHESLRLDFYELELNSESARRRMRCVVEARIRVPAGKQFRVHAGTLEGFADMASGHSGKARFRYELQETGNRAVGEIGFRAGRFQDFSESVPVRGSRFTECGSRAQVVTLRGVVSAELFGRGHGYSKIRVEGSNQNYGVGWDWRWRKCDHGGGGGGSSHGFQGGFETSYRAYNGRTYAADLYLNGSQGYYDSEAGFRGQLYNVTYSNGGRLAQGNWAAAGSSGWFQFRMVDARAGRFRGSWGDSSGFQAPFNGHGRI